MLQMRELHPDLLARQDARRGVRRRAVDRVLDLGSFLQFPTRRWYKGNY
jgi:hypothetical protein